MLTAFLHPAITLNGKRNSGQKGNAFLHSVFRQYGLVQTGKKET